MTTATRRWFAGVDWGTERHQVCLLDEAGTVVGERAFRHDGAGLVALCDWLVSVASNADAVAVAIEVPHGPVVDAFLDCGGLAASGRVPLGSRGDPKSRRPYYTRRVYPARPFLRPTLREVACVLLQRRAMFDPSHGMPSLP